MLYLGCRVLILLDKSYFARFWTLFEAWLAMRRASEAGLVETFTPAESSRHYHIEVLYDHATADEMRDVLVKQWRDRSWVAARDCLAAPDTSPDSRAVQVHEQGRAQIRGERLGHPRSIVRHGEVRPYLDVGHEPDHGHVLPLLLHDGSR